MSNILWLPKESSNDASNNNMEGSLHEAAQTKCS